MNTAGAAANGTWGLNPFWNSLADGTAPTVGWTAGDTAVFSAGTTLSGGLASGTNNITVAGTQSAAQITFEEGTNTLTGGTLNLQGTATNPGIISLGNNFTQTINSVITGFNGITVQRTSLAGVVTFNAVNTWSGPLTITSGRVNLNVNGAASTGPIIITPGNNTGLSSTAVPNSIIDLANPITLNAGSSIDISSNALVTMNLTGKITGAGNWTHGGGAADRFGTLILNNTTSDFTGALTLTAGTLVVAADHSLGNAGLSSALSTPGNTQINGSAQLAFSSGSNMTYTTAEQIIIGNLATAGAVQINNIGGNNTFLGGIQFNQATMNTIGVDAGTLTLSGQIIAATLGDKPFAKVGPGTLIVNGENTTGFNSSVNVNQGTMVLTGPTANSGDLPLATAVNITNGALLSLDNTPANNQDRINNAATLNLNGGHFYLKGSAAESTTENLLLINSAPGEDVLSTITLEPGNGRTAQLLAGDMTRSSGALLVFRTPGLGEPPASNQGQVKFSIIPQLVGGGGNGLDKSIIVGALGDTSLNGIGSELVTYDEVVGVKPLGTLDYAPAIASGNPDLINVGLATPNSILADTIINSIKVIDPNGSVSIVAGSTLTVNSGMILASASSNDGINGGGTLTFGGGNDGMIVGPGNLTVSANINSPSAFVKAGTGTLTLSGSNTLGTVYISGGTLLPTTTAALGDNSSVHIGGGGTLELPDGMNLGSVDLYLHNGGRVLGRGTATYSRSARVSDGATVILESPEAGDVLKFTDRLLNLGTGAVRPTVSLRGPGRVELAPPTGTFFGNFELRNGVTMPLAAQVDALGNNGNSLIFGPGGGTAELHSLPGGTNWGNNVIINGDANFHDASFNGTDTFGSLTVNVPATIHHVLPKGLNFIDPRLNFGNTALNANVTFNVDRPPIAGDYGRVTITNVREFGGPRSITKTGEGILTIAGSAGFTGDLNASQGLVIIPDSVPNVSGVSGDGIVIGTVNVRAGGHVDPGVNGVGLLLIDGINVNGAPGNAVQFNMEGDATGFDQLFVFGGDKFQMNGPGVINLNNLGGVTRGDYTLIDYPGNPLSDADFQKLTLAQPAFGGFVASLVHDTATTKVVLHLEGDPPPQWNVDADGAWGTAANWDPATIPDDPTASANFFGKITAPRTVTLDGPRAVAQLNFSNLNRYTLSGGALTLGGSQHNAVVNVSIGSHTVNSLFAADGNVLMNVAGGSTLSLNGGFRIAENKAVTMLSSGTLEIDGDQQHGDSSLLDVRSGLVRLKSNAGTPASNDAAYARLNVRVSGGGAVVLGSDQDLASLRVDFDGDGNQSFDLASPGASGAFRSVRVYASDLASAKTSLYGAIITANKPGAISPTDGIYDSGLVAHFGMKLGIAQLVDSHGDSYVLVRPTRVGDLNLDGVVTISDFIDLAANFNQVGATWQEGDLNYDGLVTISDFIDLASNFNGTYAGSIGAINGDDQQVLASFAASLGVDPSIIGSAVPEPGILGVVGAGLALLGGRRRRPTK